MCVTGARIGELAGAQVGQGVFANHYSIVEWKGKHTSASGEVMRWDAPSGVAEGDRFCEHDNETSKTDVPRVMCVVAKTRGLAAIDLGGALESYWKACNFGIITSQEGGWVVRRPDFSVVQISLQALRKDERRLAALRRWLGTTRVMQVGQMAAALAHELKRLMLRRRTRPRTRCS